MIFSSEILDPSFLSHNHNEQLSGSTIPVNCLSIKTDSVSSCRQLLCAFIMLLTLADSFCNPFSSVDIPTIVYIDTNPVIPSIKPITDAEINAKESLVRILILLFSFRKVKQIHIPLRLTRQYRLFYTIYRLLPPIRL